MASLVNKDYLLGHVPAAEENPRLDTQHERITHGIMKGRLVHESIQLNDNSDGSIADICCGTGVWLNELSSQLSTCRGQQRREFIGFDSNPSAFQTTEKLASDVRLVEHDCTLPFDPEYIGKFALVNMRGLTFAIPQAQFFTLFRNAISLLKPGGYLQWLDTEPQLWQSIPVSPDFAQATGLVAQERDERALVPYMPDFMLQAYLSAASPKTTAASNDDRVSLVHFSLTPGGAARPDSGNQHHLNGLFSDTVSETLDLLLQGLLVRTKERLLDGEVAEIERLQNVLAEARESRAFVVCGHFPLLVAQNSIVNV